VYVQILAHAAGKMSYTNRKDKINGDVWKIHHRLCTILQKCTAFPCFL